MAATGSVERISSSSESSVAKWSADASGCLSGLAFRASVFGAACLGDEIRLRREDALRSTDSLHARHHASFRPGARHGLAGSPQPFPCLGHQCAILPFAVALIPFVRRMPLEDSHLAAKMQVYPLDFPSGHPLGNSRSPILPAVLRETRIRLRLFPATLRPDGALPYGWIGFLEASQAPTILPPEVFPRPAGPPFDHVALPFFHHESGTAWSNFFIPTHPTPRSPLGQPINEFASKR